MKISRIKNHVKSSLGGFLTSLIPSRKNELEADGQSITTINMSDFPDLYTEDEKKEIHAAEIEDFRWEQRVKKLEREVPLTIFISQEELNAEKTKEEEIIEQILSSAYFPEREVHIYVNTYGGDVLTMFAIMDAIQSIPNKTKTIGIGKIMSAGGPILMSGKVRAMTKNSFLMIHDLSAGAFGSPEEVKAELEFMEKLKERFVTFAAARSHMNEDEIRDMMKQKRNHYFSSEEALQLGLIDEIIG